MKTVLWSMAAVAALTLLAWFWPQFGNQGSRPVEVQSHMYLSHIGAALDSYRRDHANSLPARLEDLVPTYILGYSGNFMANVRPKGEELLE
jgi:hypothetical protein